MIKLAWILILVMAVGCCCAWCPAAFKSLRVDHTMCLTDRGKRVQLSDDDVRKAVDRLNDIRAEVNPPAADMQKLLWDNRLAVVAGKWARQCNFSHDEHRRDVPTLPGIHIGQNMAAGQHSLMDAIEAWYREKDHFKYGYRTGKAVGHYTQMIFARTNRVGCGVADCDGLSAFNRFYVCNFAIGQTGANYASLPYKKATKACSSCQGRCVPGGKLCDCAGKICYNGGQLNVATCKCDCHSSFTGELCKTKHCPAADIEWMCRIYFSKPDKFSSDPCKKYGNVRNKVCPHRCGNC